MRLALEADDTLAAQRQLEQISHSPTLSREQQAYALRWAGQLALRASRLSDAQELLLRSRSLAPHAEDAEGTLPRLAQIALLRGDDTHAAQWIEQCIQARDPIVQAYGLAQQQGVRERLRKRRFRPLFTALLVLSLATMLTQARRVTMGLRSAHSPTTILARWAKLLVFTEALAFVVVALAPRFVSSLALSSVALVSIVAALLAALWLTIVGHLSNSARFVVTLALLCSVFASGYLALDFLYWSPTRPTAP